VTGSFGTPEARLPGRGPFRPPPPEVLRQLEPTRKPTQDGSPRPTVGFYEMDLSGLDLGGEWMADGIFIEANLTGARLDGAVLRAVTGGGIILRHASCCGTDFFKAELEGADFTGVLGHGIHLAKADLYEARFDQGDFWHGDFNEASCRNASFKGADLSLCSFRNATLAGADLRGVQLGWTDLSGASLDTKTQLAGARGVEYGVRATMIRFEGEEIHGDNAKDLLVKLARQPMDP
jgi:uncharacterized protein YjbI with pentapeptide repeats